MKAKELRIGNWVFNKAHERRQLKEVHSDCSVYDPIPLTEEWLLKFHSEDEIHKSGRFPNEITVYDRFLLIYKAEYKYWYVVTSHHKEYLTKIEFVHEYQNFIFILTGEELTIQ